MTILDFARSLGISKNKAKYYLRQLPADRTYRDGKGFIHLTEQGVQELKELVKNQLRTSSEPQKTTEEPQESAKTIDLLQEQINLLKEQNQMLIEQNQALQNDKNFLQEQLKQASNRADYLTIRALPFFQRRKALKEYKRKEALTNGIR